MLIWAHHPLTIGLVQVDGNIKTPGPFDHGRIVVGMRNRERGKTPQPFNFCNRFVINQAHTVPENIALLVLEQQGSLTNREGGRGSDADQARLMLPKLVLKTILLHLGKCRPLLPFVSYILPLITTNRTKLWWS